jgi:hypothetical protein
MQSNITNNSNKTQNNVVEIKKNANGKCWNKNWRI